jgi:hypothetical protein
MVRPLPALWAARSERRPRICDWIDHGVGCTRRPIGLACNRCTAPRETLQVKCGTAPPSLTTAPANCPSSNEIMHGANTVWKNSHIWGACVLRAFALLEYFAATQRTQIRLNQKRSGKNPSQFAFDCFALGSLRFSAAVDVLTFFGLIFFRLQGSSLETSE